MGSDINSPFLEQREFMVACGQRTDDVPSLDNLEGLDLYIRLMDEELAELKAARAAGDIVEVADGIIDLIYVATGGGNAIGLPMPALWDEVQSSNMAKVDPTTGKVTKREDGKILKPEGWKAPDIARVLREHGWK